jgi:hypothetical protein
MPRPSTSIAMSTRNILAAALPLGPFAGGAAIVRDTCPVRGKLQEERQEIQRRERHRLHGSACLVIDNRFKQHAARSTTAAFCSARPTTGGSASRTEGKQKMRS